MKAARPAVFLAFALLTTFPDRSPAQDARPADPPKAEFATRRRALMAKVKEAESRRTGFGAPTGDPVIVIRGADERRGEDYEEGRFRQSNTFEYLTGVEVPGSALILLPNSGQETLYLPPPGSSGLGSKRALKPGPDAAESLGFAKVESTGRLLADLFGALNDPGRPAGMRSARPVLYTTGTAATNLESSDAKFVRFVKEGAPSTTFKEVTPVVAELRKAKSSAEMGLLNRAIAITGEAQADVIRTLRPGLGENQIEAKILAAFLDGGAMRPAFASIVGSGPNSTIPHYFDNDRTMAEGDLVVVDIGAEYRYYAADITRTYPVGGKFTPRQREIYQLVLDAQSDAASKIKPGSTQLMPMTMGVREFFRKSPLRAKGEDGREYTMDHFFIHGLGHYLGMDVHDVGDYSRPLQVGEVFTIEPGIYIPSENLGVRIEDDYVVTKDGIERLSASIPSAPDEIERRMAEAKGTSPPK